MIQSNQNNPEEFLSQFLLELRADPVLAAREILGIELAPHQRIALRGMWEHPWVMNIWGRGTGKLVTLDTPVITPTGWTTQGDIRVGDELFDEQGNVCRVTRLHPIHTDQDCYRISFDDGTSLICGGDHLWAALSSTDRKNAKYGGKRHVSENYQELNDWRECWDYTQVITTRDMFKSQGAYARGDSNWGIPCSKPIDGLLTGEVKNPYILGCWLGDGTSSASSITVGVEDYDAFSALYDEFYDGQWTTYHRIEGKAFTVNMLGNRKELRRLGVFKNKHVPMEVLRADELTRLAVLQGLMDTDGFLADNRKNSGMCGIDFTNKELHEGVAELIRSLGWKARQNEKIIQYNGEPKTVYQINFRPDKQVFRLPRKAENLKFDNTQQSRHTIHMITSIEEVEPVPVRCITVDSTNHLYLIGKNLVPTHNTFVDGVYIALSAVLYSGELIVVIGPGFRQSQLVFAEVEKFATNSSFFSDCIKGGQRGIKHGTNEYSIEFKNGSWIRAVPLGADGSKIRGLRAHRLIIDEFVQVPPEIINSVAIPFMATAKDPMSEYLGLGSDGTKNTLVLSSSAYFTFNPAYQRYSTYLEKMYKNRDNDYFVSVFNYLDLPQGFIDPKVVEHARSQSTEAEFKTEWLGQWVSDTSGFYPASLIEATGSLQYFPEVAGVKGAKYVLGVDPASVYNTCGLAVIKLGEPNVVVYCDSAGPIKYTDICSRIMDLMSKYDIVRIGLDAGAGIPILNMFQEGRPFVDKDGAMSTVKLLPLDEFAVEGRRIIQVIPGTSQAVNEINYTMKTAMEDNQVSWPKIAGDFDPDSILERDQIMEQIREMESEFRMVESTPTRSGWLSFNVPSHKNKDRYSATLFANYAAKQYQQDNGQSQLILPSGFWTQSNRFHN